MAEAWSKGIRVWAAVLLCGVVITPRAVRAQEEEEFARSELAATAGVWVGDDFFRRTAQGPLGQFGAELRQGDTPLVGVRYTYRLNRWLGIEGNLGFGSNSWTYLTGTVVGGQFIGPAFAIGGVTTIAYAGSVVFSLPTSGGRFTPFVSLGAGAVSYEPQSFTATVNGSPFFVLDLGTRFAAMLGAGIRIHTTQRLAFRLEVRDWATSIRETLAGVSKTQHNLWIGGGLGLVY